jgi:predicted nucleotidyltransferase
MDLSRPWLLIRSPIDLEALVVLCGTTRPLTGREVARLVMEGSQPTVNASLRRLAELGLVNAEEAGNAYLYTLNRDHLGAPAIELIARIRTELVRRLREEVDRWEIGPEHVSMFGSAARGDGDTRSDIDLLVVRPASTDEDDADWRRQLHRLSAQVRSWTGNDLGLSEVSAGEVRRWRRQRPLAVDEIRRDAITICGPDVEALIGARR